MIIYTFCLKRHFVHCALLRKLDGAAIAMPNRNKCGLRQAACRQRCKCDELTPGSFKGKLKNAQASCNKKKSVEVVLAAKKECGKSPQGTVIRWKTKEKKAGPHGYATCSGATQRVDKPKDNANKKCGNSGYSSAKRVIGNSDRISPRVNNVPSAMNDDGRGLQLRGGVGGGLGIYSSVDGDVPVAMRVRRRSLQLRGGVGGGLGIYTSADGDVPMQMRVWRQPRIIELKLQEPTVAMPSSISPCESQSLTTCEDASNANVETQDALLAEPVATCSGAHGDKTCSGPAQPVVETKCLKKSARSSNSRRKMLGDGGNISANGVICKGVIDNSSAPRALLVKNPWLNLILDGKKIWEIRDTNTKMRGEIQLALSGAGGRIVGQCHIVDSFAIDAGTLGEHVSKHCIDNLAMITYRRPHAWVLSNVHRYETPVAYSHPQGAIKWVKLRASN